MFEEFLDKSDVVIVDMETTGFSRDTEVIQVAALNNSRQPPVGGVDFARGRYPIRRDKGSRLNARLRANRAQSWMRVAPWVLKCLEGSSFVLAWNAPFDERLIRQTYARHGVSTPRCNWRCCMQMYCGYRRSGNSRLKDTAQQEGVPLERSHDALADCQTVLAVMRKVANRGQGGHPDTNHTRNRAGFLDF